MSRIGKLPVKVPDTVNVQISGNKVSVTGPKGSLEYVFNKDLNLEQIDGQLIVKIAKKTKPSISQFGLTRTLLNNMIVGVSEGFERKLEINGVGFKAQVNGRELKLSLGFSHPSIYQLPEGVEANVEGNTISLKSHDKQQLGQTAAEIRELRKPEPYQGKGIKYVEERIRRKAGKTATK